MKWEYSIQTIRESDDADLALSIAGQHGWELVSVVAGPMERDHTDRSQKWATTRDFILSDHCQFKHHNANALPRGARFSFR